MAALAFHPLADIFPLMGDVELEELAADIRNNGLREPVWTYEGRILDGRNRYRACGKAGVECDVRAYLGDDPVAFVVSLNLKRRHLTASQLAFVALEIERIEAERAKERQVASRAKPGQQVGRAVQLVAPPAETGKARDRAAQAVGINRQYVSDAKAIQEKAPEIAQQIKAGDKTITEAKRELKERERQERRDENAAKVEAHDVVLSPEARFATIMLDPPWDWGDEGDQDQLGRARPTYSTLSLEQLLALPVAEYADTDCHLYLWITNRSLPKGFSLLERWGFRYVTCLTWCKPSFGMGNYFRGQSEHVLFGVKGSQPLLRKDLGTVFHAPRGPLGHSSKPVEFYDLVESASPGPYLEMFARSHRAKWKVWGAEATR